MKKSFIVLVLGIAATLVGCKPNYYYDYTTNNYIVGDTCHCQGGGGGGECYYHSKVYDLNATATSWELNERQDGTQFISATFNIAELTATVYNYGAVSCYAEFNGGTKDAYQLALPATNYNNYESAGQTFYYSEKIDFIYGIGWVEVDIEYSDQAIYEDAYKDYLFRLFLQW